MLFLRQVETVTKQMEPNIHQLPADVYRAELEEIRERRSAAGVEQVPEEARNAPGPALTHGLTGLAISGGGIRSSTFSLGVIQALVRAKVFKHFDYVSTVSGGGYTGSMLSSLLGTRQAPGAPFPLEKKPGQVEPLALQHLRNGSNYLSPGGLLHTLRLPLQIVRGVVSNLMLLMPWLMLAASVTNLWYLVRHHTHESTPLLLRSHLPLLLFAVVPLSMMILLSPIIARWCRTMLGWKARNFLSLTMSALLGLFLLGLVLIPLDTIVTRAIHMSWSLGDNAGQIQWALFEPIGWDVVWQWGAVQKWGLAVLAVLVAAALIRPSLAVTKSLRRLALVAVGVLGPCVLFAGYMLFCSATPSVPFLPPDIERNLEVAARLQGALTQEDFQSLLKEAKRRSRGGLEGAEANARPWALGSPGLDVQEQARLEQDIGKLQVLLEVLDLKNVDLEVPCFQKDGNTGSWQLRSCEPAGSDSGVYTLEKHSEFGFAILYPGDGLFWQGFYIATFMVFCILLVLVTHLLVNVNYTSLHQFYRDRLSRLYLFRLRGGDVVSTDDLRLSELNEPGSAAPYHLLNVTLNLQGSSSLTLRGRKADFFIFSKRYCGGPQTGYCPTAEMEKADRRMGLGTAMAISAAAASPNMGAMELDSLRCLMALLNVRLGYWAPNPKELCSSGPARLLPTRLRFLFGPGSSYLLRETSGSVTASGKYVNLSDGGHLENLGVYELLRRRCKVVVAIDGEADPRMSFPSLHALMRYAWIDLGIRIELKDLGSLRLKDGTSSQHYALGTIDYGDEGVGMFVYIKASVTGDEHPVMAHYRNEHPKFPHESTSDQFFDEHQFESYRELGEHIGSQLVEEEAFKALFQTGLASARTEPGAAVATALPPAVAAAAAALDGIGRLRAPGRPA